MMPKTAIEEDLVDIEAVCAKTTLAANIIRKYVRALKIPHRRLGDGVRPRIRYYLSEVSLWVDGAELKTIPNGVTVVKPNQSTLAGV